MKSYHPKSLLNDLQYYITPPHDCSYLENKSARMVFLDPIHRIDVVTLSELSRLGFRRSGDFVYRPECHLCRQCLSCRTCCRFPNEQHAKSMEAKSRSHHDCSTNTASLTNSL